jgi:hypothetical protein
MEVRSTDQLVDQLSHDHPDLRGLLLILLIHLVPVQLVSARADVLVRQFLDDLDDVHGDIGVLVREKTGEEGGGSLLD